MRKVSEAMGWVGILLSLSAAVSGQQGAAATAAGSVPESGQLEQSVRQYQDLISQHGGVYDRRAIELHTALADALLQLGRFDEASSMYFEALQGIRISDGLYAAEQLEILDSYTISALAQEDWAQVDRNFYLALDIAGQSVAADSPEFESLVRRFTNWKIEAHRNNLDVESDPRSIEDTVEYYEILIDTLPDDNTDKLITYMTEKGLAHYHAAMAISALPFDEFEGQGVEVINTRSCFTIRDNSGQPTRVCENNATPNPDYFESRQRAKHTLLQGHVTAIRRSFIELISQLEQDENTDPVTLATAVLALGDMNFLLQDNLRAKTQYARAHEILVAANVPPAVQEQLMGQPREISRGAMSELGLKPVAPEQVPGGLVSFEVTADGKIRNLGITGSGTDLSKENQALITERLRQSVFRPRLEAGVPVDARVEQLPAALL